MAKTHTFSDKDKGINAKLVLRYEVPYVVIALPSPVIAMLENPETQDIKEAHIGDLKHYTSRVETLSDKRLPVRRPRGRLRKAFRGCGSQQTDETSSGKARRGLRGPSSQQMDETSQILDLRTKKATLVKYEEKK
jgi:hypothetical protein